MAVGYPLRVAVPDPGSGSRRSDSRIRRRADRDPANPVPQRAGRSLRPSGPVHGAALCQPSRDRKTAANPNGSARFGYGSRYSATNRLLYALRLGLREPAAGAGGDRFPAGRGRFAASPGRAPAQVSGGRGRQAFPIYSMEVSVRRRWNGRAWSACNKNCSFS